MPSSASPETPALVAPARGAGRGAALAFGLLSNAFAAVASTLMANYLPDAVRDLAGTTDAAAVGQIGAYVNALFLAGWTLGGVAFGWAGDRTGRVRAFAAAVALFGAATLAAAWAPTWPLLVACRFLAGFGVGGTLVVSAIVVAEAWGGRGRAVALGLVSVAYPVGIVSAGAIGAAGVGWRRAFLFGVLPLALGAAGLALRESAAWLASRAERRGDAPFRALLDPAHRANVVVGAAVYGAMLVGLWATFSWLPTWAQALDGGRGGAERSGVLLMLMGMGGIVGGAFSGPLANVLGRRRTLLGCFAGAFVASALLFQTNAALGPLVYAETALLALFFGVSQGALTAYIPELFPTALRSTATGLCFNVGRVVTTASVFFVGVLVPVVGGYANAISFFSLAYAVGFAATWVGRETSPTLTPADPLAADTAASVPA